MNAKLQYVKHARVLLKGHPDYTEKWLQDRMAEDPGILGLGDVVLLERERRQDRAGRLDLLLADPAANMRYEVELMLGPTDESHIIRSIEYWDIERRRFPGYDHCAVLIAEDITSRFLNVLGLFAGTIPFIAIQLNALAVDGRIVLDFVRVLDRVGLRQDDEAEVQAATVDRNYWHSRSSPALIAIADDMLTIVNARAKDQWRLNYLRQFIGIHDGTRSRNFVYFEPRKKYMTVYAEVAAQDSWIERLSAANLDAGKWQRKTWVSVDQDDVKTSKPVLTELLNAAVDDYYGPDRPA